MAVDKICGIETEYSIIHKGAEDQNPILASSMLITSYVQDTEQGLENGIADSVVWDFQDESPANDARGFAPIGSLLLLLKPIWLMLYLLTELDSTLITRIQKCQHLSVRMLRRSQDMTNQGK